MSLIAPSSGIGFWEIVARAKAKVEEALPAWFGGKAGGLSDLNRNKIIAEGQADLRKAGATIEDQQEYKEEMDRFIDTINEEARRKDPVTKALKYLAGAVTIGIVTFAAVKALK